MPPTILARDIRRSMDHSILTLAADPGLPAGRPDAYLSLYWIGRTTEVGPLPLAGHLAYLWVAGSDGAGPTVRVLTDSVPLATGLASRTNAVRWELPGTWPEPVTATFVRTAASPLAHTWRVTADDGLTLEARWQDLGAPVFATGLSRDGESSITTVLVSAGSATLAIDGRAVPGVPFPDPIWTPWFGTGQTSCVLGLGETIHVPIAAGPDTPGQ
jgi:hypothetical protein